MATYNLRRNVKSFADCNYNFNILNWLLVNLDNINVDGETLTVKAANVLGTLTADQIIVGANSQFEDGYDPTTKASVADIDAVKAYADQVAADAQTAAEAVAVAEAALAQTNAEAYADGIVSAEEQARIDQAIANLAEAKAHAETQASAAEAAAKTYAEQKAGEVQAIAENIANGYYPGTFINGRYIYSPIITGQDAYFEGTIRIGNGKFIVDYFGNLSAANGNFFIPWDGDGVYNTYAASETAYPAARWKRDDANYLYQDPTAFMVYLTGQKFRVDANGRAYAYERGQADQLATRYWVENEAVITARFG
jgi:hypothetical protein